MPVRMKCWLVQLPLLTTESPSLRPDQSLQIHHMLFEGVRTPSSRSSSLCSCWLQSGGPLRWSQYRRYRYSCTPYERTYHPHQLVCRHSSSTTVRPRSTALFSIFVRSSKRKEGFIISSSVAPFPSQQQRPRPTGPLSAGAFRDSLSLG